MQTNKSNQNSKKKKGEEKDKIRQILYSKPCITWLGLRSSRSKSIFTTPSCLRSAAHKSGVRPDMMPSLQELTCHCSKSRLKIPLITTLARNMGVRIRILSIELTSHSFIYNTATTIPTIPRNAAPWSLVNPLSPLLEIHADQSLHSDYSFVVSVGQIYVYQTYREALVQGFSHFPSSPFLYVLPRVVRPRSGMRGRRWADVYRGVFPFPIFFSSRA